MSSIDLLEKISDLCSQNKIVPFLGAGCSAPMLNYNWDTLMSELARDYSLTEHENMRIAQSFIDQYGKDKFCDILSHKLSIESFDDDLGYIYLAVCSMRFGTIYTTNQDNVMEKCCEKHGYSYKSIITLDNLISADIRDGLYIKYHGDYSTPDSVVFSEDDYLDRIFDTENFLDIKLKSDMLGKYLLFIGYSFRDMNLKLFFRRLKNVFGKIPDSYLIAWEVDDRLRRECQRYNINIVDPHEIYPNDDTVLAYYWTIIKLSDLIFKKKTSISMKDFFDYRPPQRVVSKFDIGMLDRALGNIDCKEYIQKFRSIMDTAYIPTDFEADVVKIFIKLSLICTEKDCDDLRYMLTHLKIKNEFNIFIIMVYFYVANNSKTSMSNDIFSYSYVRLVEYPAELIFLALAVAFEVLNKHNIPVSDFYRGDISSITDYSVNISALPHGVRSYIIQQFDKVWEQKYTTYENPVKRQARLYGNQTNPKHNIDLVDRMYQAVHNRETNPFYDIMFNSTSATN